MDNKQEIDKILTEIQADAKVQKMKQFIQHGNVSTYEHCESVARLSYSIDRRLSLHSDLKVLLTGAMLHDFYLYDWHEDGDGSHRLHGVTHAKRACDNAKECFSIDEKTSHDIYSHMWPLNPERITRYRAAWIECLAAKYVYLRESLFRRHV